jgi:phosphoglycerate-specific signal transduction histidine kinase
MPQISREEIAAMISQALKDLTSQLQATKPDEKSEISRLRELMEFQQELLAQAIPQRGEPEISDKDRTLLTLMRETGAAQEFFRAMRELIATPEQVAEPANWRDRVLEVASQNPQIIERVSNTLERIVARILPNPQIASSAAAASAAPMAERSRSKMGRTSTTAAPTRETTEESPPATQAAEEGPSGVTLDSFVLGIKEDIQEGNDPDEAVADAATLFSEQPELGPIIIGLLEKSNEELFAVMHQAIGAKLDLLSNANEYLDGLRDGVRKRLRIPQNESS